MLRNLPKDVCILVSKHLPETIEVWQIFAKVFVHSALACEVKRKEVLSRPVWVELRFVEFVGGVKKSIEFVTCYEQRPDLIHHQWYYNIYEYTDNRHTVFQTTMGEFLNSVRGYGPN